MSRSAASSAALSRASTPSAWRICACRIRLSRVNSTSPSLTSAPSAKWTPTISVSRRDLTATLAIGVTVPSASRRTGSAFIVAVATSTGMARPPCWRGAWATAPSGRQRVFVCHPAPTRTATTTPHKAHVRFFITLPPAQAASPHPGSLCYPRISIPPRRTLGRLLSYWGRQAYPLVSWGTHEETRIPPLPRCAAVRHGRGAHLCLRHADRHLERQLHQAARRPSRRLAVGTPATYRMPPGNQM